MRPSPFQAYLRIMMGCDKFCTYCVVPSVRGPEQSRPPSVIVAEARQLADQGVKELTLIGQTVNSYKYQEPDGRTSRLSDLLASLHEIPGFVRIKFVTNFPNDMTDDLLQAVRDLPRVARYLHVPAARQFATRSLKRMKRPLYHHVCMMTCSAGFAEDRARCGGVERLHSSASAARPRRRSRRRCGWSSRPDSRTASS